MPASLTRSSLLASAVLLAVVLTACEDPFAPQLRPVPEEPSTAVLFDFETSELRAASAFDVVSRREVRTDQTAGWDFLLAREGGQFEFRPRNVVLGGNSTAGLQSFDGSFEELRMAPEAGYATDEVVPIEEGAVFSARSRQEGGGFGIGCLRFLKLEVLSLDSVEGSVTIRYLGNPNCGRRTLVPGATGSEQEQ